MYMIRFIYYFSKEALRTVLPFLSFKGLTHAYLLQASLTHRKYLKLLFFIDNDSISVKSVSQVLCFKLVYTFILLLFLISA